MQTYAEKEIAFLLNIRDTTDLSWPEITEKFNKKFNQDKNLDSLRKTYNRYKEFYASDDNQVQTLRSLHRTKRNSSRTARENRAVLDVWERRDDLLETVESTVKNIALKKIKVPKPLPKSRKKKSMTMELLFSDVHYGKKIDNIDGNTVDIGVIRDRVRKVARSVIKEVKRESAFFNIDQVVIAMLGDLIENANFHGVESTKACEFSTSRQVHEAIDSIFFDLLVPIASTGVKVHLPCVTGNHDRWDKDKTYVKPGEDNATYIIYKVVQMLCERSGLKNVTFDIVSGLYTHTSIYGNVVLYEHGDELRSINRDAMVAQMGKRQGQIGKVIDFYRVGHWHEPVSYGQGRIMVNGSVPGQDSYADSKGFWSEPVQILNYYVKTEKRSTCFFRSFPIYLANKK